MPVSISKPVNLEVGAGKATSLEVDGLNRTAGLDINGVCPRTAGYLYAQKTQTPNRGYHLQGHDRVEAAEGQQREEGPRTAPLPAEMEAMMSKMELVGVGVGLGIGLAITTTADEQVNPMTGHMRSYSATNSLKERMVGLGMGLRKRGECC